MNLTNDILAHKWHKDRFIRVDVFNGGDDMKSNDVRMKLNRNLHAQFKRVDGNTNDERMAKLLDDSKAKYDLIELVDYHKETAKHWRSAYASKEAQVKTLTSALVVSIVVSVCSVAYVCVVNGWFL